MIFNLQIIQGTFYLLSDYIGKKKHLSASIQNITSMLSLFRTAMFMYSNCEFISIWSGNTNEATFGYYVNSKTSLSKENPPQLRVRTVTAPRQADQFKDVKIEVKFIFENLIIVDFRYSSIYRPRIESASSHFSHIPPRFHM